MFLRQEIARGPKLVDYPMAYPGGGDESRPVPVGPAGFPMLPSRGPPTAQLSYPRETTGATEINNILFLNYLPQDLDVGLLHKLFSEFPGFREIRT